MKTRLLSILAACLLLLLSACAGANDEPDSMLGLLGGTETSRAFDSDIPNEDMEIRRAEMADSRTVPEDGGMDYAPDTNNVTYTSSSLSGLTVGDPNLVNPGRKIIRTVSMDVETLDYDRSKAALEGLLLRVGGYSESFKAQGASILDRNRTTLRQGIYTLRVPAEKLDEFLGEADSIGQIVSSSMHTDDVTDHYFDIEAHLASLSLQEERILAILEKAEVLTDVLALEQTLANVRFEIESLTGSLRKYDGMIAFSTVHLTLREVVEATEATTPSPKPKGVGEKISQGFSDALTGVGDFFAAILVFITGQSPILLTLAVVVFGLFFLIRAWWRRTGGARSQAGPSFPPSDPYPGWTPPGEQPSDTPPAPPPENNTP